MLLEKDKYLGTATCAEAAMNSEDVAAGYRLQCDAQSVAGRSQQGTPQAPETGPVSTNEWNPRNRIRRCLSPGSNTEYGRA